MTALHDLTATEQAGAIAKGEVSSVELVSHYLDRIARHDGELHAFITVLGEHALHAAASADDARTRGASLGPLHGVPLALKDLHPAAGLPTTFGSAVFADLVTPVEGAAIANLRGAGAVIIGKTNAPELGPTCYTDTVVGGTTVTPYGHGLSASGSSGGAAAAVAAGLVGIAHGSDALGSIRTPAANCGLVGFKPSRGRVAGSGLDWIGIATEGPLARTVADAALFLDVMGGPSDTDLWHRPAASPSAFREAATATVRRPLRVGRLTTTGLDIEVDPACLAAVTEATTRLADAGHHIEDIPGDVLPDVAAVRPAVKVMLAATIRLVVETAVGPDQRDLLMPYTRWLASHSFTAVELVQAQGTLRLAAIQYRQMLGRYDLILSPTTTAPPLPTAELRRDDAEASFAAMGRWSAFTPAANRSGAAAVSLPVHLTDDGLPIGAQLVGLSDELLVTVAAEMERSSGWAARHPAVWFR